MGGTQVVNTVAPLPAQIIDKGLVGRSHRLNGRRLQLLGALAVGGRISRRLSDDVRPPNFKKFRSDERSGHLTLTVRFQ
jgi:hypothetical protein